MRLGAAMASGRRSDWGASSEVAQFAGAMARDVLWLIDALTAAERRGDELRAQDEQYREFITAHTLVEAGVTDFDLHAETVERLKRASEQPHVLSVIRAALERDSASDSEEHP